MGDNAMRRHFGNEYDEPYVQPESVPGFSEQTERYNALKEEAFDDAGYTQVT